jgi:hypothetical protein
MLKKVKGALPKTFVLKQECPGVPKFILATCRSCAELVEAQAALRQAQHERWVYVLLVAALL